jgi:hypothetical protein
MAKEAGGKGPGKNQYYWLIYFAAFLAGMLLIAHAMNYRPVDKIPAKLGIALLYSAFAFMVGGTKGAAIVGTVLIWAAVILTFFV